MDAGSGGGGGRVAGSADAAVASARDAGSPAAAMPDAFTRADGAPATPPPAGSGEPGVWTKMDVPGNVGWSVVVDPVRPNAFYAFMNEGPPGPIHVVKSIDYGKTWTQVNTMKLSGDPWGAAIDPNPKRDPSTPAVLYTPAGYGALGLWKSVDGGVTWTQLFGARNASGLGALSQYWPPDLYAVNVLPDDPPNHILVSFHAGGFRNPQTGSNAVPCGLGESTDGGKTWVVHPPPSGFGSSHYMVILDAQTWLVVGQDNGIWKTSTAGRIDGAISTAAWKKVDTMSHFHGSMQAAIVDDAIYIPGQGGIKRSTDRGETWTSVYKCGNCFMSTVIATASYLYADYMLGPNQLRSARADGTKWERYTVTPAAMKVGTNDYGAAASTDGKRWYLVTGNFTSGLWRYIE